MIYKKIYLISVYLFSAVAIGNVCSYYSGDVDTARLFSDSLSSQLHDSLKLIEGKKLYKKNCRKCHALYKPKEYKFSKWKENLEEMKYKAELSDHDYELIYLYLETYSKK